MQRQTFTVAEAAMVLGISRSKAYELVAGGAIRVLPLQSRRRLIPRAALEELLGGPIEGPSIEIPDAGTTHTLEDRIVSSAPSPSSQDLLSTSHSCTRGGWESGR